LARIERVEAIRIDRSHPEFITVERKRLRARRRRRQPQRFGYMMHAANLVLLVARNLSAVQRSQPLPIKAIEARVSEPRLFLRLRKLVQWTEPFTYYIIVTTNRFELNHFRPPP
jgi:hypothetical protein